MVTEFAGNSDGVAYGEFSIDSIHDGFFCRVPRRK